MAVIAITACVTVPAHAQTFGFGRAPTAEELKAVFPSAAPDGSGLPAGRGSAKEGVAVYKQKCVACHGPEGKGTPLHRGLIPLGNAKPVKLDESLVPYATTVWDFINRAMPWTQPGTLTPDEAYAVTAYVLYLNKIVGEDESDVKAGKVSISSPIARALIGKEVGDVVEVSAPGGTRSFEILKIRWL